MRTLRRKLLPVLVVGVALTAAGCGSKATPGTTQAKSAPVKKAATPAESLSPYLVGAVTTGKNGATMLHVKFELGARPEVGDPVDVDLVLVPAVDNIERIAGTIQSDEGLEIVSGATIDPAEKPVFGVPIHRTLKVRAKRDGIFTLSAQLAVDSGGQTLGPVYSMPLIAGNGLVDAGAAPMPGRRSAKPTPTASAK